MAEGLRQGAKSGWAAVCVEGSIIFIFISERHDQPVRPDPRLCSHPTAHHPFCPGSRETRRLCTAVERIMWTAIYYVARNLSCTRVFWTWSLSSVYVRGLCFRRTGGGGRLRGRRARAVMMRIHCARARSRRVDRRRLVRIPSTLRIQIHVRAASGSHSGRWTVECTTLFRPPANRAAEA